MHPAQRLMMYFTGVSRMGSLPLFLMLWQLTSSLAKNMFKINFCQNAKRNSRAVLETNNEENVGLLLRQYAS